jgi:hypothetical protein
MKKRRLWIYLTMIVALSGTGLFLTRETAQAVTNITCRSDMTSAGNAGDNDSDGFTDYQECLWNGQAINIAIAPNHKIYGQLKCPGKNNNSPCPSGTTCHCLDPNNKDLFLIIMKESPLFPSDAELLQYFSAAGLGITVHTIYPTLTPLSRIMVAGVSQQAVMIKEDTTTTGTVSGPDLLGFANTGTPNDLDKTTVYTQRIRNFIINTCGNAWTTSNCADSTGATGDVLVKKYILHTIAHEVGHVLRPLAPNYDSNYGGYHYQPGTNDMSIMDQSIYYTYDGTKTTFYIGTAYKPLDQISVKLK